MEHAHKKRLKEQFQSDLTEKHIYVLGIKDLYQYMDPKLIELLRAAVDPILEKR
tara:strand:+ start:777 stop:938 length:162 start_codon:yes stop_codon:yes gene_type:complete